MKDIFKYIISGLIAVSIFYLGSRLLDRNEDRELLLAQTALIQKEINNTSKLVVTEMKYAKVFTYEGTKSYGWDFFRSQKSAIIISNAEAQISYDLKQLKHELDPESKTIFITYIPQPEIKVNPHLDYFKMDDGILNKFEGRDINKMERQITAKIKEDILKDEVIKNAQNRLLTELSNIYLLSSSMGWKLVYNDTEINSTKEMDAILF
ncbi:uncharacterized protein DUF4230 [Nonlabens xylanidelens]|uniref:Uncharacterized protein DUF4230 n=1 Tax=Nonlabens xylanidelens TaxID=191564 RepID=A0A2S6IEW0_9FLAO|nr:DUF4230 domain-containing protein [Nonlabens xylanidelens]PPK92733.1 uncharacterized protein DUF4230 [Nonlabens xylanidelens]PQJ19780.1 hypothetical protein BST94_05925 [Nonlabens xylanidelens]